MTIDEFWGLIERSRGSGGDSDYSERLANLLQALPSEDVADFYNLFLKLKHALFSGDAIAACTLLNGGYCGDDGFEDFCNWLISRGRKYYELALANFDNLSEIPLDGIDGEPAAMFEEYAYVARKVYEMKTGNDISSAPKFDLGTHQESADSSVYQLPSDELIAQRLPMLWKRLGRIKQQHDASAQRLLEMSKFGQATELNVSGLGRVRVGSVLRQNGSPQRATIQKLFTEHNDPIAKVLFENHEYPESVYLSSDYFTVEKF